MNRFTLMIAGLLAPLMLGKEPQIPIVDNPKGLHIAITGTIDAAMERTITSLTTLTTTFPPQADIIIDIDSPGGYLPEAYRIMAAVGALALTIPQNIICVGGDKVSSAAVSIFQACALRLLHENSQMFLHLPAILAEDGKRKPPPRWLVEHYAVTLGMTYDQFLSLLTEKGQTRTLSAREAIRLGLADALIYNPNMKEERNAKNP